MVDPALLLHRQYLKVVAGFCEERGLMDSPLANTGGLALPFDLRLLPVRFPAPGELTLFARPKEDWRGVGVAGWRSRADSGRSVGLGPAPSVMQ